MRTLNASAISRKALAFKGLGLTPSQKRQGDCQKGIAGAHSLLGKALTNPYQEGQKSPGQNPAKFSPHGQISDQKWSPIKSPVAQCTGKKLQGDSPMGIAGAQFLLEQALITPSNGGKINPGQPW